jgi:hypothetical protein
MRIPAAGWTLPAWTMVARRSVDLEKALRSSGTSRGPALVESHDTTCADLEHDDGRYGGGPGASGSPQGCTEKPTRGLALRRGESLCGGTVVTDRECAAPLRSSAEPTPTASGRPRSPARTVGRHRAPPLTTREWVADVDRIISSRSTGSVRMRTARPGESRTARAGRSLGDPKEAVARPRENIGQTLRRHCRSGGRKKPVALSSKPAARAVDEVWNAAPVPALG